jgi:hypothetical protein
MAEHVVKESYALKAWKGTPQDVADLFSRAFDLAAETDTTGVEWSLSITVETATGEIKFEDLPEFREYGKSSKLAEAEKIRAHISAREGGVTVMVWLEKKTYGFDAASISVSGSNHVAVSGLKAQLGQLLDKGKRHRPRNVWTFSVGLLILALIAYGAGRAGGGVVKWSLLGLTLLVWLGVTTSHFWVPRLVPDLEILDPDDPRTRYERWRGKLFAAAGALLLVVIGAVLQAGLAH